MVKIMKYIIAFIFYFILFSATAQYSEYAKKIIFKKENGNAIRVFKLPLKMICYFKDGKTQKLILEDIINDTLTFKKYYNQQNFDCTINSISWIEVRSSQKVFQNTLFSVSVAATLTFASLTAWGLLLASSNHEEYGYMIFPTLFVSLPATIISSFGIGLNANAIPFGFETNKWKVYVK